MQGRSTGLRGSGLCALTLAVVTACTRQPLTVSPADIHHGIKELREEGRIEIRPHPSGAHTLTMRTRLPLKFPRRKLFGLFRREELRELPVAELVAGCPENVPFAGDETRKSTCLLMQTSSESITLGHRVRPDWQIWKTLGGAVLVSAIIGSTLVYLDACKEPDDGC